jgi:hypothetical protein
MKNPRFGKTFWLCSSFGLLLVLAAMLPSAMAQIFSQDLTIHATTTSSGMGGRGGGTTTTTDYYSKNAMKMSSSDGKEHIIRFDLEKIVSVDHKAKTYTEMTFPQMQETLNKVGASGGANQQQLEAMRKIMGQVATSFTVTPEGPGEVIAGYPTEKYLIKGPMDMEIWAAASLKIPTTYYDVLKLQMPSNPMFDMKGLYEQMKKISGIPLKSVTTVKMMNMESTTTKIVTSIEKGAVPDSVFETPAGYKLMPRK